MAFTYKRRKPALLRHFWLYRYLIGAAFVLGVILWFILINNTEATVVFPFGLGQIQSTTGILILLSALAGSLVSALVMMVMMALQRIRSHAPQQEDSESDPATPPSDDRPPPDYASKTGEGFSDARWSSREG